MFYLVLELSILAFFVTFVIANIIVPAFNGTELFPWFKRKKIDKALREANEDLEVAELEALARSARARAEEIRKQALVDSEKQ